MAHFRDLPNNMTDTSDINTIIEKEERKTKAVFFAEPFPSDFPYQNCIKRKTSFWERKRPFPRIKDRKLTSNRIDPELPHNGIQTSKYIPWNFIPRNLLEQFSKKANLYFLFIGIMQTLPAISISENMPVIFVPLTFILIATAIKDYWEDYKRKKSDREENLQRVLCYESGQFSQTTWRQLRVGNIIKVFQDEYVPADLILLSVGGNNGTCFIETKNLDGETNLKIKSVQPDLRGIFIHENFEDNRVIFEYERPNPYLYSFSGNFSHEEGKIFSLESSNFLLRGCSIKNTQYICGFVAYTGHETKIMLNSFKPKVKKSNLEIRMGGQIIMIFCLQIIVCALCSISYLVWYTFNKEYVPYLSIAKDSITDNLPYYNFFVRFGNWILIFTNFVPISLLVTLEAVKLIQGYLMSSDPLMKSPESQNSHLTVQSSSLNEELGQIKFVFSDKTGTLTCNKMNFKKILINGSLYGDLAEEHEKYIKDYHDFPRVTNVDFHDMSLLDILNNPEHNQHEIVKHTLFFLALCHTVVAENKGNDVIYSASSPDELALINFAKFCGVEFRGQAGKYLLVEFQSNIYRFKLLQNFEFSSARKRQSIVLENENHEIVLYCKGADSVLETQLSSSNKNTEVFEQTWKELKDFACQGLRTLVLAERKIERPEYEAWVVEYDEAKKCLLDNRAERVSRLQESLEKKLMLIGATAIQDKLQEGAADTIQGMKAAGINVWVLTGDKIETAINIGYACGLLDSSMQSFVIEDKSETELESSFEKCLTKIENVDADNNALIIHGDSLIHTLIKPFLCEKMTKICRKCISVLCCRVSPKQKQEIVTLMRSQLPGHSTLAIGDGANDVNMITAAHVGIGIKGLEGQQAARASDYSISEFRFLRRLLFYHGRECYRRNSTLVLYNFFKNTLLVMPQFWFGIFNYFSGQTLYESIIYQIFNIFYTSFPIMIYAVIDKEFQPHILVDNSLNYYHQGMNNSLFNAKIFWKWFSFGALNSLFIVMLSFFVLNSNFVAQEGFTLGFWAAGTMVYGQCVFVANLKIIGFSHTYNILSFSSIFLSTMSYLCSLMIINVAYDNSDLHGNIYPMMKTPSFHMGGAIISVALFSLDFGFEMHKKFKLRETLVREREQLEEELKIMRMHRSRIESSYPLQMNNPPEVKDQQVENDEMASQIFLGRRNDKKPTLNFPEGKNSMVMRGRLESLSPSFNLRIPIHGEIMVNVMPPQGFVMSQDTQAEERKGELSESSKRAPMNSLFNHDKH